MKATLTKSLVSELRFEKIPVIENGKIVSHQENTKIKPYIIFDNHPDAPAGFGVRVGKETISYILSRRINGKVTTVTVGRHPELLLAKANPDRDARTLAADIGSKARKGIDVNAEKRATRKLRDIPTLGDLFDEYLNDYTSNQKRPPKDNTIKAIKKAKERLSKDKGLLETPANEVTKAQLSKSFKRIAETEGHRTAAEQTMRWVSGVFNARIEKDASEENVEPEITRNPAVAIRSLMRTKQELREAHKKARHPIPNQEDKLGKILNAVWYANFGHRLGAEFFIINLLCGSRKSEPQKMVWADKLPQSELAKHSYASVKDKVIMFKDTKNRTDHYLPMGPLAYSILKKRLEDSGDSIYVFPPYRANKKRKVPHYSDNKCFINRIKKETGISFTMHDLRRTFSRITNSMDISSITLKRLLNHTDDDVTSRYATPDVEELRSYMERIELELMKHAPFTATSWHSPPT